MIFNEEYVSMEDVTRLLTPFLPLPSSKVGYMIRRGFGDRRTYYQRLERSKAFYHELNRVLDGTKLWWEAKPTGAPAALCKELELILTITKRLNTSLTVKTSDAPGGRLSEGAKALIDDAAKRAVPPWTSSKAKRDAEKRGVLPWGIPRGKARLSQLPMAQSCLKLIEGWLDEALILANDRAGDNKGEGASEEPATRNGEAPEASDHSEGEVPKISDELNSELDELIYKLVIMWVKILGRDSIWSWRNSCEAKSSPMYHFVLQVLREVVASPPTLSAVHSRVMRLKAKDKFVTLETRACSNPGALRNKFKAGSRKFSFELRRRP